jgi:hypothetical protein
METAKTVVGDILQEILLQANEQDIEAVDFQFTVRYMNRFMNELAVTSPLGYTQVNSPDDKITIPAGAINGLIFNTALRIISSFDMDPSPMLVANAREGLKVMRKLSLVPVKSSHPSTLPIGSGNYDYRRDRFYNDVETEILTEVNGGIALEDGTE